MFFPGWKTPDEWGSAAQCTIATRTRADPPSSLQGEESFVRKQNSIRGLDVDFF